ncbi:hypothetical protein [Halostagnicola sp. A-GB9-2]|uniref:hypothetical protein n=1 Tax=Halostagnicola sp. A-GB9-2 TaxID=3048066 RepID=UPI0024C0B0E0|nr:hypothetical protein [Halostagnicola sp. A-GB9-2]MDJ1434599.1 hypothetical protein [Halostagnicola sp. A-GB9-2]
MTAGDGLADGSRRRAYPNSCWDRRPTRAAFRPLGVDHVRLAGAVEDQARPRATARRDFAGASIAALTGVDDRDHGIAPGIEETTYQIGSPIGIAVLSAVAVSHTETLLANGSGTLVAQTAGYRLAFAVAIGFALVGVVIALVFLGEMDADQDPNYESTSEMEGVSSYPIDSENDD